MDATIRLEHELLAIETEQDVHVMLELEVPEQDSSGRRAPVRVAMALDRSGSMHGAKLDTVKRAAAYLAQQLGPDDEVALVTFDDEIDLVAPLGPVHGPTLAARIARIGAGGMTNLSGGWLKALEEVQRRQDGVRRVLLLTDGLANVGVTDHDRLVGIARSTGAAGVSTTTIGVGAGFAEQLLTDIADAAGGQSWYAEGADDLPRIFADEFEGLVSVAAQNVSVEVRPTAAVELVGVLNEYPSVGVDGGVQVTVGDAYAGQTLRVVLALRVPALATMGPATVAELVLRYVTVGDEIVSHTTTLPVVVNAVSAEEAAAVAGDQVVTDEVVVLLAAKAADESRRLIAEGESERAADLLRTTADRLREVAPRSGAADELLARAEVFEATSHAAEARPLTAAEQKRMHYSSADLRRGRHRRKRGDGH